jgi:hypothetical protein
MVDEQGSARAEADADEHVPASGHCALMPPAVQQLSRRVRQTMSWALPRERYKAARRAGGKMFPMRLMGASPVDARVAGTAASAVGSADSGVPFTLSTQRARPGRVSKAAGDPVLAAYKQRIA